MLELLGGLLIMALVIYVVTLIIGQLALPNNVKQIVYIIVGLFFLIWLLRTLGIAI